MPIYLRKPEDCNYKKGTISMPKSEKLFAVVNPYYERVSMWMYNKAEANETCEKFNEHVGAGHMVVDFNVVPVTYAVPDVDGNYA
jgi:hypothetical protein